MKKRFNTKSLLLSLMSVMILGTFIIAAIGSFINTEMLSVVEIGPTEYLGNGVYQRRTNFHYLFDKLEAGTIDDKGRWHGKFYQQYTGVVGTNTIEEGNMVHGYKHGTFKLTRGNISNPIEVKYICYDMGKAVDCEKSAQTEAGDTSSFEILTNKYPRFLLELNLWGFENEYIKAYLDTLDEVMNGYEFNEDEYVGYYSDATWELEETPYDSIITFNSDLSVIQGLDMARNGEFRLAVIDRFQANDSGTFHRVQKTYPGYLDMLNEYFAVNTEDFESYCSVFDSLMHSYGTLNKQDPFYIDTLDMRMFRAFEFIYEDSTKSAALTFRNTNPSFIRDKIDSYLTNLPDNKSITENKNVKEVNIAVVQTILMYYAQGDILQEVANEAYMRKHSLIYYPVVTTSLGEIYSLTSAQVGGNVFDDGGDEGTIHGITWATTYNPTTNDHIISAGTGIGQFSITLTNLDPEITYYARAYATNSVGTAYGNCIKISTNATGLTDLENKIPDFSVYPNPNSGKFTFRMNSNPESIVTLKLVNSSGQEIEVRKVEPSVNHTEQFDVSNLNKGIYLLIITLDQFQKSEKIMVQ